MVDNVIYFSFSFGRGWWVGRREKKKKGVSRYTYRWIARIQCKALGVYRACGIRRKTTCHATSAGGKMCQCKIFFPYFIESEDVRLMRTSSVSCTDGLCSPTKDDQNAHLELSVRNRIVLVQNALSKIENQKNGGKSRILCCYVWHT